MKLTSKKGNSLENFRIYRKNVVVDMATADGGTCEGAKVYVAAEMVKDAKIQKAMKSYRVNERTIVGKGKIDGKMSYVCIEGTKENADQLIAFLRENGLTERADAVEKLYTDHFERIEAAKQEAADRKANARKNAVRCFYFGYIHGDYGTDFYYGIRWYRRTEDGELVEERLLDDETVKLSEDNPVMNAVRNSGGAIQKEQNSYGYDAIYPCTEEQEQAAIAAENAIEEEKKAAEEKKAEERKAEAAKKAAEEAQELHYHYYPMAGNPDRQLHSLGATEYKDRIEIYTTVFADDMEAPGISEYAEELSAMGAEQDGKYQWSIPLTDENREKVQNFLQSHDMKRRPWEMGYCHGEDGIWVKRPRSMAYSLRAAPKYEYVLRLMNGWEA